MLFTKSEVFVNSFFSYISRFFHIFAPTLNIFLHMKKNKFYYSNVRNGTKRWS